MFKFEPFCLLSVAGAALLTACATQDAAQPPTPATETPEPPAPAPLPAPKPASSAFPASMSVCPVMTVANPPHTEDDLTIKGFKPLVVAAGKVTLATAPVQAACFSSGFGPRGFGHHKGVDYFNRDPVDIYAAGTGVIKEKSYRDDFGNQLVIDHGSGVFTRYAHLQDFSAGMTEGKAVKAGDVIGRMGNTSAYQVARHLHYEVLTGTWGTQAGSFALTPVDVLSLPATGAGS